MIWRQEEVSEGRTTKVPYQAKHPDRRASVSNPATWATYEMAVEAASEPSVAGVGIVLGSVGDLNLAGIDLDGCIDENGVLDPEADEIVRSLPSYWEVSPSGTGLKCVGYGQKPAGAKSLATNCSFERIEVYDAGRWFALTGKQFTADVVEDIQEPLVSLCRDYDLVRQVAAPKQIRPIPVANPDDTYRRASAYLATMDPAIQGCGGHSSLFKAACAMAWGFDLPRDQAIQILANEFNPRCSPAWNLDHPGERHEFERKVDQAITVTHDHPRGHLLHDESFSREDGPPVDFSGLTASVPAEPLEPAEGVSGDSEVGLPKHLLEPPGLLGRICGWLNRTSAMYQPELALGNAIAFAGAVLGKKVRTEEDGRTNFYCLGLSESCTGKDHSRKQISILADMAGIGDLVAGEDVSSDAAVIRLAAQQPACLLQLDEIGHFFSAQRSRNASTHEQKIIPTLTKLFTSASVTFKGKEYADSKDRPRVDIHEPCVCLYGTATPDQVWGSLSLAQVQDGFMGRLLIFGSRRNDPDRRKIRDRTPPKSLIEAVAGWGAFSPPAPAGAGNILAAKPGAMVVPPTAEAESILDDFGRKARIARSELLKVDGGLHPLWGRAYEQATKLALLASADEPQAGMTIGAEAARWACELVEALVVDLVEAAENRVADSNHERDVLKILDVIRAGGSRGVQKKQIGRKARSIKARDRDEILKDLVALGDVRTEARTTGLAGPQSVWYIATQP